MSIIPSPSISVNSGGKLPRGMEIVCLANEGSGIEPSCSNHVMPSPSLNIMSGKPSAFISATVSPLTSLETSLVIRLSWKELKRSTSSSMYDSQNSSLGPKPTTLSLQSKFRSPAATSVTILYGPYCPERRGSTLVVLVRKR